jgi:hypothetical protein
LQTITGEQIEYKPILAKVSTYYLNIYCKPIAFLQYKRIKITVLINHQEGIMITLQEAAWHFIIPAIPFIMLLIGCTYSDFKNRKD